MCPNFCLKNTKIKSNKTISRFFWAFNKIISIFKVWYSVSCKIVYFQLVTTTEDKKKCAIIIDCHLECLKVDLHWNWKGKAKTWKFYYFIILFFQFCLFLQLILLLFLFSLFDIFPNSRILYYAAQIIHLWALLFLLLQHIYLAPRHFHYVLPGSTTKMFPLRLCPEDPNCNKSFFYFCPKLLW